MADVIMQPDFEYLNSTNLNVSGFEEPTWDIEMMYYPLVYPITIYYLSPIILTGRIVHVIWYVIGSIGNIVSMRIWANPRMKRVNSSALYLVAVTISDITYQVLHVFMYLKYFWGFPTMGASGFCELWNVLYMIPQYASQFFVLGFTVERFISIYRPFRSERFSKRQRAPREIAAIVVLVVAISLPQGAFWNVDNRGFCNLKDSDIVFEIYNIWSWITEMIIFVLVPLLTLVLNIFVMYASKKAFKEHGASRREENGEPRIHHSKGKNCRPSTITLLYISFFRILTQLPVTVTYTIQNIHTVVQFGSPMPTKDMQHDPIWRNFIFYWGIRLIIEMIGSSHHALSVFIFYASTKQFRTEINILLHKLKSCILGRKEESMKMYNPQYRYSISQSSKSRDRIDTCSIMLR